MNAEKTKIDRLRAAALAGDWHKAISIAAKFPILGQHRAAILSAWEGYTRPDFQRQVGKDPAQLIAAGIDALKAKYHV